MCYTQNLKKCQLTGHIGPWVPQHTCLPYPRELNGEILKKQTSTTLGGRPCELAPASTHATSLRLQAQPMRAPASTASSSALAWQARPELVSSSSSLYEIPYCGLALPRTRSPRTLSIALIASTVARQHHLSIGPRV